MLHAVIMAGGSGTRFWPESRRAYPKQFLRLTGDDTLLQQTWKRFEPLIEKGAGWVITGDRHRPHVAEQLPELAKDQIVAEPIGRNTAPAIGLMALLIAERDPSAVLLVVPADHAIGPDEAFHAAVREGLKLIASDPERFILLGIKPDRPATGYGYMERGAKLDSGTSAAFQVAAFKEKPDQATAQKYLDAGRYYWNSGIFLWRADAILKALKQYAPEIHAKLETLRPHIGKSGWSEVLAREFPSMPSISIDYAVLEKAERVAVIEAPFTWDDVGSWEAVGRLRGADASGNVSVGLHVGIDTKNTIVRGTGDHLVATLGLEDCVVVHTPHATLVAKRGDDEALRKLLAEIEKRGLEKYL